ncbi:Transcription factor [Penicillium occitanis (nom. inval.)]|nr:Transcription factor [Penicillium occitanis (nom. inval.)]PCG89528.1 hypothetical protein PENOC_106190 [Penicillium occitanis (nom. inval.)]
MSGICSLPGKSFMSASDPLMGKRDQAASSRTIHAEHEPPERVFPTPSTYKALSESGRLAVQKGKSRYVSSTIWNVLANNVEEMQDVLDSSTSEDESEDALATNSQTQGFLFDKACYLIKTYEENVAPLLPIFHWPTVRDLVMDVVQHGRAADKVIKTLMFTIYHAAAVSLPADECHRELGVARDVLLTKFRFAVQQAIAEADLLSTQSTVLLQAVVLFLMTVRGEDNTRFVWSITSMVVRIGQYLGLHRDGDQFGLTSFDTEMRRRLWWHILLLDMRSSEEHGTDRQISEGTYSTKLPSNVNDECLYPGMMEPVRPQIGFTEMTFCLIRCEVAIVLNQVTSAISSSSSDQATPQSLEQIAEGISDRIQQKYTSFCDESIPFQKVCVSISRLLLANLWIHIYFRRSASHLTPQDISAQSRDKLFHLSLEVIQISFSLERSICTHRWSWLFHANAHWSYVAFLLSELCIRPTTTFADEAWKVVDLVQGKWHLTERNGKRGMLWRPLQRLLRRATIIRSQIRGLQEHNGKELATSPALAGTATNRYAELDILETEDQGAVSLTACAAQGEDASYLTFSQPDLVDVNFQVLANAIGLSELESIASIANWSFL